MPAQNSSKHHFSVPNSNAIHFLSGGLFVSRGRGLHPKRKIDFHELIIVRAGVLGLQEEERSFRLEKGQTLLLYPNRQHGGNLPYPPDLEFFWLHFKITSNKATAEHPRLAQHQMCTRPDYLYRLARMLLENQDGPLSYPAGQDALLHLILVEAAHPAPNPQLVSDHYSILASRTEQWLRQHSHKPISTKDAARAMGCNQDYLGRVFHQASGHTITERLHQIRLQHARQALIETNTPVNQIAYQCGFSNLAWFRRLFRKQEGLSPIQYRRQYSRIHINTE